uniref:Uncharacterized protein n=1 Tax=Scleropages formosus TaxID=113540 RepID=A0A8C9U438_SCLFO
MCRVPARVAPCLTLLALFSAIYACEALQGCGDVRCPEGQRCCAGANGSATARCCALPRHTFLDSLVWVARKLSGVLILLLLFAMGYFIQRIVCPRPRRHRNGRDEPSSLLGGRAAASQDSLLERAAERAPAGGLNSPVLQLPAYDEVKDLPTYEESMRVGRERSCERLLGSCADRGPGAARADMEGREQE